MKVVIPLYIFILFSIIHSKSRKKYKKHKLNECEMNDFDFYVFSLQYKPGMCYQNSYCDRLSMINNMSNKSKWTVHGLWPDKFGGRYDEIDCLDSKLDQNNFPEILLQNLNLYWPSLIERSTNYEFHNHEWRKHGSCIQFCHYGISEEDSQRFYFSKILELRKKFSPKTILRNFDSLTFTEIVDLFSKNFNTEPQLICKTDREINKQYLVEVRITLKLDFSPFIYYTMKRKSRCNRNNPIYLHNF